MIATVTRRRRQIELIGFISLFGQFWTEQEVTIILRTIIGGAAVKSFGNQAKGLELTKNSKFTGTNWHLRSRKALGMSGSVVSAAPSRSFFAVSWFWSGSDWVSYLLINPNPNPGHWMTPFFLKDKVGFEESFFFSFFPVWKSYNSSWIFSRFAKVIARFPKTQTKRNFNGIVNLPNFMCKGTYK